MSFERRHAPLKHDHAASEITFDNAASGLTADDVQAAIDELDAAIGSISLTAANVSYDNTSSGLTADDVQEAIDELASGGSGVTVNAGAMTFLDKEIVTGADVTEISFSGLDLDTDEEYLLEWEIENPTGSSTDISLYYNADTTATNYDRQGFSSNGTTNTGARVATGVLVDIPAGTTGHCRIHIKRGPDGVVRGLYSIGRRLTTTINWFAGHHSWETPDVNVTGITLSASTADSIGIGSKATLYKISSQVDSVSIPNDWTFTGDVIFDGDRGAATFSGATPSFLFDETDAATDERLWEVIASAGALTLQLRTDANGVGDNVFTVNRTAETVDDFTFSAPVVMTGADANGYHLVLEHTAPFIRFSETDAATDEGEWDIGAASAGGVGQLRFRTRDDALSTATNWMLVERDGTTCTLVALTADRLTLNGQGVPVKVEQDGDLVITSNNVFQNTDLVISLTAGSYEIELDTVVLSHATPDMEVAPVYSGTVTSVRHNVTLMSSAGTVNVGTGTSLLTSTFTTTATWYSRHTIHITVSNAGTFAIQARQVTSSGTSVTFYRGSQMTVTKTA